MKWRTQLAASDPHISTVACSTHSLCPQTTLVAPSAGCAGSGSKSTASGAPAVQRAKGERQQMVTTAMKAATTCTRLPLHISDTSRHCSLQVTNLHRHVATAVAALLQDLIEVACSDMEQQQGSGSRPFNWLTPVGQPDRSSMPAIGQPPASPSKFSVRKYSTMLESCWSPLQQQHPKGPGQAGSSK